MWGTRAPLLALMIGVLVAMTPSLAAGGGPNPFTLQAGSVGGLVGSDAAVPFLLHNTSTSAVMAWSFGACHQGPVDVFEVTDGAVTAVVNDGGPPDFLVTEIYPGEGWTTGVIIDVRGEEALDPGIGLELHVAHYALLGEGDALLQFCDTLGDPPILTVLVVAGENSVFPETLSGSIAVTLPGEVAFVRGDCNDDGTQDIADGIFLLANLFQGGAAGPCEEACNADALEDVDVMDALHLFYYLFLGGDAPPAPFPDCGLDPDAVCGSTAMCP